MTKGEYIELCSNIHRWNTEYYVNNETSISDIEYDEMLDKLQEYEKDHPEDVLSDSPSQLIGGGKALCGLTSQQKMFSADEVNEWWKKCGGGCIIGEPKIDGCTLALDYHGGKLVKASLRDSGNGDNDVTDKARYIGDIPMEIDYKKDIQIRGEVYIPLSAFEVINERQKLWGEKEFANPRNLCAGTMQADNPVLCKERGLKFMLWGWDEYAGVNYNGVKMNLCELGFNHPGCWITYYDIIPDVGCIIDSINTNRHEFDFPIDGIVFKINDMTKWESIGVTEHHPKYMTAYKFKTEEKTAVLKSVDWQVAASGKVTPVANFTPVSLHRTTVTRATMNNAKWIMDNLGELRYGDELIISKGGEIIPKIIGVKHTGTGEKVEIIDRCPMCGQPLAYHQKKDGTAGVSQFCDNEECPSRTLDRTKSGKVRTNQSKAPSISPTRGGLENAADSVINMFDTSALEGKSVCVSGTFAGKYSRSQLETLVEMCGGKLASGVSKKTSYLVAGNGAGPSKLDKAMAFNVPIISDEEFLGKLKVKS